jgi:transcription antitermination factor NusG
VAGFGTNYGQILEGSLPVGEQEPAQWFAIHVRSRHEKKVADELRQRGIHNFLPLVRQVRRWSDRKKVVEFPLFSCYVFVQIVPTLAERVAVLNFHGVLGFIGPHHGTPIPSEQIESIRTLLLNDVHLTPESFIRLGQRVRIRGGALDGVEGILSGRGNDQKLIVSVDTIQRSISVSLEGYEVEPA